MRKSKVFVSLALAGAMVTTSVLGSVAPKAEAAVATAKLAAALDTDYKNQEIANANGRAKDGSDATSRMYNMFYQTEEGETGTKGPGKVILNKLENVKCGDIYGVRFFTNANPEVENEAKFTGVIQFASSGRPMREANGAIRYSENEQSDGKIKYTLQSYTRLINYLTGDIVYLNNTDKAVTEAGVTLAKRSGSVLKGYTCEGFTVDADGKFVKKLSKTETENLKKQGYEIADDYWTTPNFSTKKFPTWEDPDTKKVSKYAVLMADDGSLTYMFKSPIGDDTNTNFQANLVVYNASDQRTGIGVTAVQLLGKDGKPICTDAKMGDLNNVTGTKFSKSSATLGAGETVYVPAALSAKSYTEKYTGNTKPVPDTIKYVYKTGAGIEYSVADTSIARIVYGKEDVQKKVMTRVKVSEGVFKEVWSGKYELVRTNWLPSVQGLKAGATQLIATPYTVGTDGKRIYATNKTAKINIYVKAAPTSVKVSNKKKTLYVGDTLKMKMKLSPADAVCSSYTFSSSKKNIASVAPNGTIKAVKPGKTTIKVTTYNGKSTSFKLTVKAPKKTSLKSVKVSGRNYTVKWKKSSLKSITGYKISISSTSKFAKKTTKTFTVKGRKKTSKKCKISASLAKKISASGKAYVRIQTYTKVGTKTYNSSASKAKKVSVN